MSKRTRSTLHFDTTLSVDALRGLIAATAGAVQTTTTIPILAHVKLALDASTLSATACDLELQLAHRVNVERAGGGAAICVPHRQLSDIARRLEADADVTLTVENDRLHVMSGRAKFALPLLEAEDFPAFGSSMGLGIGTPKAGNAPVVFETFTTDLARCLSMVRGQIAHDDTRPYLMGAHIHVVDGSLVFVATDGHALCRVSVALPKGADAVPPITIPRKAVDVLIKQCGHKDYLGAAAELSISTQMLHVTVGDWRLSSKLIDGTYPDYARVIPEHANPTHIQIAGTRLSEALGRCAVVAATARACNPVRMCVQRGALVLSTRNSEGSAAEEDVEMDIRGPDVTIGFNPRLLIDLLAVVDGADDASIALGDHASPARIDCPSLHFTAVLMSMRV